MASLIIVATLMTAVGSTMLLASRAIGDSSSGGIAQTAETNEVVQQIASELGLAVNFTERSDKAVAFSVPDRDGDGQVETIRYAWSGTAGDALTRQYNGGTQAAIAENVHHFNLTYLLKAVTPEPVEPPQESDEVVLIYHDNAPGGSFKEQKIKDREWAAQYLKPTLPTNVLSWKITSVDIRAKASGAADAVFAVQIRTADANQKPTSTVLAEATVNESTLAPAFEWITVSLGPVADLDPSVGYCIVVKHVSGGGESATIEYEKNASPMTPDSHWMRTTDAGTSWSDLDNKEDMRFFIHGAYTTQGDPQWP